MAMKVEAVGNLTADPELKQSQNGKPFLNARMGCTRTRKNDQTGQWDDVGDPLFVEFTLWEEDATFWAQHLHKGTRLAVTGVLQLRSWSGNDGMSRTEIGVGSARVLGVVPPRTQQQQPQQAAPQYGNPAPQHMQPQQAPNPAWNQAPQMAPAATGAPYPNNPPQTSQSAAHGSPVAPQAGAYAHQGYEEPPF